MFAETLAIDSVDCAFGKASGDTLSIAPSHGIIRDHIPIVCDGRFEFRGGCAQGLDAGVARLDVIQIRDDCLTIMPVPCQMKLLNWLLPSFGHNPKCPLKNAYDTLEGMFLEVHDRWEMVWMSCIISSLRARDSGVACQSG